MFRALVLAAAKSLPSPVRRWLHSHRHLYRFTSRLFTSMVSGEPVEIAEGPMRGLRLAPSEHTSHAHLSGVYERETLEAVDRLVQPGWICYDLGASIGYISLLMARRAARVFAFEPAPHARAEMERQLAVNGFTNVEIIPTPMSGSVREVRFTLTDAAFGSAINETETRWPVLKLQTSTLDLFIEDHPAPDFLKIDIEGEEEVLFDGAARLLETKRPLMVCELHSEAAAKAVLRAMERHRYVVTDLADEPFVLRRPVVAGDVQVICRPL